MRIVISEGPAYVDDLFDGDFGAVPRIGEEIAIKPRLASGHSARTFVVKNVRWVVEDDKAYAIVCVEKISTP